jgi:hypothetical protein
VFGESGEPGADGADGDPGADGEDGVDGEDGRPGAPGRDANAALVIDVTGVDENGTEDDVAVAVGFAAAVDDALLRGSTLTFSFSRRVAPEPVATVLGGCGAANDTCFTIVDGRRLLDIEGDDDVDDGLHERDAVFHLAFDRDLRTDARDRLSDWINGLIGLDGAFRVDEVDASEFAFTWLLDQPLPTAAFNDEGDNVGTSLLLPPFTVRDVHGDGNALTEFVVVDEHTLEDQDEPRARPFNPPTDITTAAVLEDGRWAVDDVFVLRFTRAMDRESTEQAIEIRLEEGPFDDVIVLGIAPDAFQVTVKAAVDLRNSGNAFALVLPPEDVSTVEGISNSTEPLTFTITDVTVPTLTVVDEDSGDTMAVTLATGVPARKLDNAQENNLLVGGDRLTWRFSEPMEPATVTANLTALLNAQNGGNGGDDVIAVNAIQAAAGNTEFSYTLQANERLTVPALLQLGALAATVTDRAAAEDIGIAIAPNQVPKATRDRFIVLPQLDVQENLDTVTVVLGATTPREDNTIEAGDALVFDFTKKMDPLTTKKELATRIVNGTLTGGVRRGNFVLADVENRLAQSDANDLVGNRFTLLLAGTEELEIQGDRLSFGDLAVTVLDDNGLSVPPQQLPAVSAERFDPALAPTLATVVGARVGRACGDSTLVQGDTVTFTFSEPLAAGSINAARTAIIDALAVNLDAGAVVAGDIALVANTVFTVTLPQGAVLPTATPTPFNLLANGITDANTIPAGTLAATMAPVDVLAPTLAVVRNLVVEDGALVGGDQLALTFNCQMDEAVTLAAVQTAVDATMGDGTARTTTANNLTYVIEILPGRRFPVPAQATLNLGAVATDLDIAGEQDDVDDDGRVDIAGPFALTFDDIPVADVTLTYVNGSADGFSARYEAAEPLRTGTWFLSRVSAGLSRDEAELPVVFTDFE